MKKPQNADIRPQTKRPSLKVGRSNERVRALQHAINGRPRRSQLRRIKYAATPSP